MIVGPAAATASRLYLHDLERAYTRGREVYDPDYALATDPDVYEVVRRDPTTQHAIQQRKQMVAGSRCRVLPADDEPVNRRAAAIVEKILQKTEELGDFTMARFHLADAVFRGSAWGIVEGRPMRMRLGNGPARTWWVPTGIRPVDKRRFRQVVAQDGSVGWEFYSIERRKYEPLGERRAWFVRLAYDNTEDTLGYGRGLIEALYHALYAKGKVWSEGLAGLEKWAQGITDAEVNGLRLGDTSTTNLAVVNATMEAVRKMRSRFEFVHGEDVKLNFHETTGSGHEMVLSMDAVITTGIRVLILGANLPTSATSGGSYALAEVQENSTETLVDFDRRIMGNALTRDLVGLLWMMNRAPLAEEGLGEAESPTFMIGGRIRKSDQAATQIGAAINAGVRGFREDEVFEAMGLTPAGPHDRRLEIVAPTGAGVATAPLDEGPDEPEQPEQNNDAPAEPAKEPA